MRQDFGAAFFHFQEAVLELIGEIVDFLTKAAKVRDKSVIWHDIFDDIPLKNVQKSRKERGHEEQIDKYKSGQFDWNRNSGNGNCRYSGFGSNQWGNE